MAPVGPTHTVVDEMRRRIEEIRKLVADTRRLFADAHRVFERNLAVYKDAQATIRRLQDRLAQSRSVIQRHAPRRTSRRLHLLISARIDGGQLPDAVDSIISGAPGFGGECAACDGYIHQRG